MYCNKGVKNLYDCKDENFPCLYNETCLNYSGNTLLQHLQNRYNLLNKSIDELTNKPVKLSYYSDIEQDIVEEILSKMDCVSRGRFCQINKHINTICKDEYIYNSFLKGCVYRYPEYTQLGVEPNINLDEDDFMTILELNGIYGNEKILLLNAFNTCLFPQQKYDILEANNLEDLRTPEIVQVPLRKIVNDIKNKIERKELDADAYSHEWLKEYNRGKEAIPAEINTDKYDINTALLNYNRPDSDGECIWSKELWAVYLTTIGNRLRPMANSRDEFDKNYSYYMDMDYDVLDGEGY
jgi:hypothetical protein